MKLIDICLLQKLYGFDLEADLLIYISKKLISDTGHNTINNRFLYNLCFLDLLLLLILLLTSVTFSFNEIINQKNPKD